MYFIQTAYTLTLKTNISLTGASSLVVNYSGPFQRSGTFPSTADLKNAVVDITDTLIDRKGTYKLQVVAIIDGQTRRSSIASVTFEKPLS